MTRGNLIIRNPKDFRYEISKQPDTPFYADDVLRSRYYEPVSIDFNLYLKGINQYIIDRSIQKVISEGIDEVRVELISKDNERYLLGTHYDTYFYDEIRPSLFPEAKNDKIRAIHKIIQNGPATIIIDIYGNKTIVKYQNDSKRNYYSDRLGLYICLIKYIINDDKLYSDIIKCIFDYQYVPDSNILIYETAYSVLCGYVYRKDIGLINKWFANYTNLFNTISKAEKSKKLNSKKKYKDPWAYDIYKYWDEECVVNNE